MSHSHHGQAGQGCGCGCGSHGPQIAARPSRDWGQVPDSQIICPCLGVSKGEILAAIHAGAHTLPLLKTMTQAGRGRDCRRLHPQGRSCETELAELVALYARPPAGLEPPGGHGH
jgi:bacterioferritin-associated ferredoxin